MQKIIRVGKAIDETSYEPRPWIVEGLIREQQGVILMGDAGLGKSIFSLQMLASITTGAKFLGNYVVPRARKVCYVQSEGEDCETLSRWKRINMIVKGTSENLMHYFCPGLPLNDSQVVKEFVRDIEKEKFNPDMIVLDPLYKMKRGGSLCDDEIAGDLTQNIDAIKMHFECAILILHHEHRKRTDQNTYRQVNEGRESIFGSFIWLAWPNHIFQISKRKSRDGRGRRISTGKNRNDDMVEDIDLSLHGDGKKLDTTLYFEEVFPDSTDSQLEILALLSERGEPMEVEEIILQSEVKRSATFAALKSLTERGKIKRVREGVYAVS